MSVVSRADARLGSLPAHLPTVATVGIYFAGFT